MREKVIFDTNIARNTGANTFLGSRELLEQFANDADIVIPDTVIEEIKRQKRSSLKSNKDKFITNPFHKLIGVKEEDTKTFDIEAYIQKLKDEETIPFEVIDLKDNNVLPQIKELAINKKPPFVDLDNSDKGFKDALIYFSVLEYLQEIPNKYVFVCSNDDLLTDALKNHLNIIPIKTYEEFKQQSVSQFYDDYFIEKINEELGITVEKENIKEYWYNINDNKVVLIDVEGEEFVIETDSGEIINSMARSEYTILINALVNSSSFNQTDEVVAELVNLSQFFNDEEILEIFNASYLNSQINWIINKPQIKELIGSLYEKKEELITDTNVSYFLNKIFK